MNLWSRPVLVLPLITVAKKLKINANEKEKILNNTFSK
jgi:hypothetical protein